MLLERYYREGRILVTGGAALIGSHPCERSLVKGAEMISVENYFTGSRRNIALADGLKETIAYFKHTLELA